MKTVWVFLLASVFALLVSPISFSNDTYAMNGDGKVGFEKAIHALQVTADIQPQPPRCSVNTDCPESEYCAKEVGDCLGFGECTPLVTICLDDWVPVCGCDGKIYSNACYAARAGVNIVSVGVCPDI